MNKKMIQKLQNQFDALAQNMPERDVEFWFARDLQEPLGYARWKNFLTAIKRAISSCETTGYTPDDHFRGVTKMVSLRCTAGRYVVSLIMLWVLAFKVPFTSSYSI